jgi:two-component system OmpR family sensor kinase
MSIVHSLRWRLQFWHGVVLAGVLLGFGIPVYILVKESRRAQFDEQLHLRVTAVAGSLRPPRRPPPPPRPRSSGERQPPPPERRPPPDDRPNPPEVNLTADQRALFSQKSGFYFALFLLDGKMVTSAGPLPPDIPMPTQEEARRRPPIRSRNGYREIIHTGLRAEWIIVGGTPSQMEAENRHLAWLFAATGLAVLILGLGAGWLLTTRAIRPIDAISETAARISTGSLNERIDHAHMDRELGALAAVLNETFGRLEASFERHKQFTGDAAHELRTPVTVILSQTQLALRGERDTLEYREALEACERAARRMRNLTESLLVLSKLDAHSEPLASTPVDLAEIAREGVELLQPLAREHGVSVHGDFDAAPAIGDRQRLGQILTNLVTNAFQHSPPGGEVRVITKSNGSTVSLQIGDHGPGIESKHLPHLFERFYRTDESRNRRNGGAGLGLAICKAIADAHRATLSVESTPGEGTTFTLRMKRAI